MCGILSHILLVFLPVVAQVITHQLDNGVLASWTSVKCEVYGRFIICILILCPHSLLTGYTCIKYPAANVSYVKTAWHRFLQETSIDIQQIHQEAHHLSCHSLSSGISNYFCATLSCDRCRIDALKAYFRFALPFSCKKWVTLWVEVFHFSCEIVYQAKAIRACLNE